MKIKVIIAFLLILISAEAYSSFTIIPDPVASIPGIRVGTSSAFSKLLDPTLWTVGTNPGQLDAAVARIPSTSKYNYPGGVVDLPQTVTSTFPKAQLAASAAKVLKILPYVGTGIALYELYQSEFPNSPPISDPNYDGYVEHFTQSCAGPASNVLGTIAIVSAYNSRCSKWASPCGLTSTCSASYNSPGKYNFTLNGTTSVQQLSLAQSTDFPKKLVKDMTESELSSLIQNSSAPSTQLAKSLVKDQIQNNLAPSQTGFPSPSTESTVTASPVTTPSYTDSPSTYVRPDGQSETTTKTHTDTVTPHPSGTTLSNIDNTYDSTTTTITNVTNNTTNTTTTTTTTTNPTQDTKQNDLCQLYPEILACSKLNNPTIPPSGTLETRDLFDFSAPLSSSGSCPSDLTATLISGQLPITLSYQPLCQFGTSLKPIVLALFIISSIYVLTGSSRKV